MLPRFYRTADDFLRLHHGLKLTPCPHCKGTGALILHDKLYGYAERDECRKTCRGQRVFCNNRKARKNGCGRTFSVWAADKLRRMRLGANALWTFLKLVLHLGKKAHALRALDVGFSVSSAYRIWKHFVHAQSRVRTALALYGPPPQLPHARNPVEQTIAHLEAAFPQELCPVVAFQHRLQVAFW